MSPTTFANKFFGGGEWDPNIVQPDSKMRNNISNGNTRNQTLTQMQDFSANPENDKDN